MDHITPERFMEVLSGGASIKLWNEVLGEYIIYNGISFGEAGFVLLRRNILGFDPIIYLFESKPLTLYDAMTHDFKTMGSVIVLKKYKSQLESIVIEE